MREGCSSAAGTLMVMTTEDVFVTVGSSTGPFYKSSGRNKADSEVTKNLDEALEEEGDLDVLIWWKDNCTRYSVLARISREVLAIPVSTVASESAFSTGGRVLDAYRSSLSSTTVEALICTQDWVKKKMTALRHHLWLHMMSLTLYSNLSKSSLGGSSASTRLDDDD
ncbi:hypothetical protein TSUD_216670 [Trifolium subterraneum]|uniref:HAT C-terminal dimerisation domain-containing protein n=1 Tax=Trifolium subterraneum TaxID=3900 RepID=A0A2Z6M1R0_TRISU|nr:hypothetical protein TSUD_216670 [Trifolium subterraneum]